MVERKIFKLLKKELSSKYTVVITGMRRVGKTTTLKYLFEQIKSTNKIFLDLERLDIRHLFGDPNYDSIIISLKNIGLDFSKKAYIFLDEIQLLPNITSVIKYLYDHFNIKFVVSGSSSFYLKNHFSESMSGRKIIFNMFPLSFDEFLLFKNEKLSLYKSPFALVNRFIYKKHINYYNEYIKYGGFPEVVLSKTFKEKKNILNDILQSYVYVDVQLISDFSKIDELYNLIKLLASRSGNRIDYTQLSSLTGINRNKIKDYIILFEQTFLIHQVPVFSKNPDVEISKQKKFYFTDSGMANHLAQVSSGILFENCIAMQLSHLGNISYYRKKTGQEIDFILNKTIAIEVKETPTLSDLRILKSRANQIGLIKSYLVGCFMPSKFNEFVWGGSIF